MDGTIDHTEERIAGLLRLLPPAPDGWIEAAQELPSALRRHRRARGPCDARTLPTAPGSSRASSRRSSTQDSSRALRWSKRFAIDSSGEPDAADQSAHRRRAARRCSGSRRRRRRADRQPRSQARWRRRSSASSRARLPTGRRPPGIAAQAAALEDRLLALADDDATAFGEALAELRGCAEPKVGRSGLGPALLRAARTCRSRSLRRAPTSPRWQRCAAEHCRPMVQPGRGRRPRARGRGDPRRGSARRREPRDAPGRRPLRRAPPLRREPRRRRERAHAPGVEPAGRRACGPWRRLPTGPSGSRASGRSGARRGQTSTSASSTAGSTVAILSSARSPAPCVVTFDDDGTPRIVEDDDGDVCGHGTACAGIVRALAPDCRLHSVRVLGSGATGTGDLILAGLRHAIEAGHRVVNLSLSTTKRRFADALHDLADDAYFNGTVLVASAHNSPVESYPWRFSSVVSVGSHEGDEPLLVVREPRSPGRVLRTRGRPRRRLDRRRHDEVHRQQLRRTAHRRDVRAHPREAPRADAVPAQERALPDRRQHGGTG